MAARSENAWDSHCTGTIARTPLCAGCDIGRLLRSLHRHLVTVIGNAHTHHGPRRPPRVVRRIDGPRCSSTTASIAAVRAHSSHIACPCGGVHAAAVRAHPSRIACPCGVCTGHTTHYVPLSGRLVRVYCYRRGPDGIEPQSVQDLTRTVCEVREAGAQRVRVAIACSDRTAGRRACVMVAFTHFTPDVFAPHLLEFQHRIIAGYADAPLAGVCKDEWGFPPCFDGNPAKDSWYSRGLEAAYADRTGGRDLVRDALLMCFGERGSQAERRAAINQFMELCRERNSAIEHDFFQSTEATFGPSAVVATHPTWWPYPDSREFKKNGLDWWAATRDLAQTDEVTPLCVRTALAKKWGSAVWYNMFYDRDVAAYDKSLWMCALGGGRVNYHPIYPVQGPPGWTHEVLLSGGLTRGDSRVRLLNFISTAPLECSVAVVFGHASALNWAGPGFDDVGMDLANRLWRSGFYADLIPTSEITSGALKVAHDGSIHYGTQRYSAVVLYHPEFERSSTAAFFQQAAHGPAALVRVGDWTSDFDGNPFDGNRMLPESMIAVADAPSCAVQVIELSRQSGNCSARTGHRHHRLGRSHQCRSPPKGQCRLVDGTRILLSGRAGRRRRPDPGIPPRERTPGAVQGDRCCRRTAGRRRRFRGHGRRWSPAFSCGVAGHLAGATGRRRTVARPLKWLAWCTAGCVGPGSRTTGSHYPELAPPGHPYAAEAVS